MFDDEKLIEVASESYSVSDTMKRLGLVPMGGNHTLYKKRLENLGFGDFQKRPYKNSRIRPIEDYLSKGGIKIGSSRLKRRLIKSGLKEEKCEECGIAEWDNKPLNFHLDHVNGDNTDNRLENLKILCPNCHSQTPTYGQIKESTKNDWIERAKKNALTCRCGAIIKRNKTGLCKKCYLKEPCVLPRRVSTATTCKCGVIVNKRNKTGLCRKCYIAEFLPTRKVNDRPSLEQLQRDVDELGYRGTGVKYGVSDTNIRKWMFRHKNHSMS